MAQSVYCLLPNGALDTAFGTAGIATGPARTITDMAVAPDGSIVTAGDEVVAKFTAAGKVDTTFNGTGSETVPAAITVDYGGLATNKTLLLTRRLRINLRPAKSEKLRLSLREIASLASGNYFLFVQVTDSSGASQWVSSAAGLAVG